MTLLTVNAACQEIVKDISPLPLELCFLDQAHGRTLAQDVSANLTQPPFDSSSMDGFAVRFEDLTNLPTRLTLIGESAAGHLFDGTLNAGQAVRIFTGAAVPNGADTIIIQENTEIHEREVKILQSAKIGAHIRPKGLDFHAGDRLLKAGQLLDFRALSLAASMNHDQLAVRQKPKVAIIATGDELQPPGSNIEAGQIVSSTPIGLKSLIEAHGGSVQLMGIAKDDLTCLGGLIDKASEADILVTIGGASVGDHDLVNQALTAAGLDLSFWKIAMRPGKPLMYGKLKQQRVLGLPGNPVSSFICSMIFLLPLIYALLGRNVVAPQTEKAYLSLDMQANGPRAHYIRAKYDVNSKGQMTVMPFDNQDSSLLSLLTQANCLLIRPPHHEACRVGAPVSILRF